MAAFVGDTDTFKWNQWAQKAGICRAEDEVRRFVIDVGFKNVALVYIEKHLDKAHLDLEFPSIENVRQLRESRTSKSAAVAWMCFGVAMMLNAVILFVGR